MNAGDIGYVIQTDILEAILDAEAEIPLLQDQVLMGFSEVVRSLLCLSGDCLERVVYFLGSISDFREARYPGANGYKAFNMGFESSSRAPHSLRFVPDLADRIIRSQVGACVFGSVWADGNRFKETGSSRRRSGSFGNSCLRVIEIVLRCFVRSE